MSSLTREVSQSEQPNVIFIIVLPYRGEAQGAIDSSDARVTDANPRRLAVRRRAVQREGDREEDCVVFFDSDGKEYQLTVANAREQLT